MGLQPSPPQLGQSTSRSLIARLKLRDSNAWARLVDLYGPLIYYWGRDAGLAGEDARDLMQDVLQIVWKSIGRFHHDQQGDTFRGWLWTITRNKINEHRRASAPKPSARGGTEAYQQLQNVGALDPLNTDTAIPSNGYADLLHAALDLIQNEFAENVWRAFALTALQDRSSSEAAAELGMTATAVRQAKFRVLRRLRKELGDVE